MRNFQGENSPRPEGVEWDKDLDERFEKEWKAFVEFKLQRLKAELGRLPTAGIPTQSANESAASRADHYDSLNRDQRVSELINNFRFYLPGGWYRKTGDNSGYPEHEKVLKVLDLVIKERKMETAVAGIADSPSMTSAQKKIMLELFLAMREKGFDITELRG